jgi:hypothetical protein
MEPIYQCVVGVGLGLGMVWGLNPRVEWGLEPICLPWDIDIFGFLS